MKKNTISLEDAENCVDTLNNIKNIVTQKVEDGEGLSDPAFKLVKEAVNTSLTITDNKQKVIPFPSLESNYSRIFLTKLAEEALDRTIDIIQLKKKVSLESISPQLNDPFVDQFVEIIEEYKSKMGDKPDRKLLQVYNDKIEILILKRFGLNTKMITMKGQYCAIIVCPMADSILDRWDKIDTYQLNPEQLKDPIHNMMKDYFDKSNNKKGFVDLKNSKISGYFTLYTNLLILDYHLMIKAGFTSRELCAVLLHEIGHAFNEFEFSNRLDRINVIVADAADIVKNKDTDKKEYVFKTLQSIDDKIIETDIDKLFSNNRIVSSYYWMKVYTSIMNCQLTNFGYKYQINEKAADSFAGKFGLGYELISFLDKAEKTVPGYKDANKFKYENLAQQIILLGISVNLLIVVFPPIVIYYIVIGVVILINKQRSGNKENKAPHLQGKERLLFIKEQTVALLKEDLDGKTTKNLIDSIEVIDRILKTKPDEDLLFTKIFKWLTTSFDYDKEAKNDRTNERLVNNNLFLKYRQLKINLEE